MLITVRPIQVSFNSLEVRQLKRGLAMILGATIGASLLVIDTLFPIHILASIGLTYSITIIGGLVLGVVLIIPRRTVDLRIWSESEILRFYQMCVGGQATVSSP